MGRNLKKLKLKEAKMHVNYMLWFYVFGTGAIKLKIGDSFKL